MPGGHSPGLWRPPLSQAQSVTLRACVFFHAVAMLALWGPGLAAADLFEERISPVLLGQCLQCHDPEKQKGGLRVDFWKALLQGGDSGPVVVPGQPDQSLLLKGGWPC